MNCPLCGDVILEAKFAHGIEVDVCPNCKGIWLDRGELERMFASAEPSEGSAPEAPVGATTQQRAPADWAPAPAAPQSDERRQPSRGEWQRAPSDSQRKPKKQKKKKKKGWADLLEDVFDEVLDL